MTSDETVPAQFPDPVVTANLYCHRRQDEVIHGALVPLRQEMAADCAAGQWRLWFARYPKRGEHLKIRLHGPEPAAPRLRSLLAGVVEACFAALPPVEDGQPRTEAAGGPPIELGDGGGALGPDPRLPWAHHRRPHIPL